MLEIDFTELNNSDVFQVKTLLASAVLFFWGLLLTPLSIKLADRFGLIDLPAPRKIHDFPIPRGAGLILWVGFLFWALLFAPTSLFLTLTATGASLVFFAGYIDDMLPLTPFIRLLVQIISATIVTLPLWRHDPLYCLIMTLWITGCTNAYNLIDGMNGLSLTMAIIALVGLAIIWSPQTALPLVALCLGVLRWNFPRAYTFLGDGGVYLLGFLTASFVGKWLYLTGPLPIPELMLSLIFIGGVPVIDTLTTILRRVVRKKSPFLPDRGHIHHRLLDMNISPSFVLFILAILQGLSILLGIYIAL